VISRSGVDCGGDIVEELGVIMERRHIEGTDIIHIGKEANNTENELLESGNVQVVRNEENERLSIIEIRQCDAEREGIDRKTRWRMKI
jgi:hypothetical protein